jgi:uncharacterized phage protein gp47/JayE
MTVYPLPTLACTISPTGITSPSYSDILSSLLASFQSIYGSDSYISPDAADYQLLAIFGQSQFDSNQATITAYNAFSPSFAQGTGLSAVVKINGLRREVPSQSTVQVTVGGTAGTPIFMGVIGDDQNLGTTWDLPENVEIDNTGAVVVEATCTQAGSINASSGTLTQILTPTLGWQSVTNALAAVPGAPVEMDSTLRQRQAVSTSLPALSVLDAMLAEVLDLPGVTRATAYENDTGTTNAIGIPKNSVAFVVAGGVVQSIGNTIALTKTPGTGTYGTTQVNTVDRYGIPNTINFYILSEIAPTVVVTIKRLAGYVSSTAAFIQQAVSGFLNSLAIGEYSYLGRLWGPANLSGDAATAATGLSQTQLDALSSTYTVLSITQSRAAPPTDTTVTGGPYVAGSTAVDVASVQDIFQGSQIQFVLDDASLFVATVSSIAGLVLTIAPGVPVGRNIPTGANVYLHSDIQILFYEAAEGIPADITVVGV